MMKNVNFSLHYFRAGRVVSWALPIALGAAVPALAQYPGQIAKKDADTQTLRAVAVLEWTGEAGKPKAARLVPVSLYDGNQIQDAGLYMTRPEPLALAGEVEYQLKKNGATVGLFDIKNTGREQGSWVAYGEWKPAPAAKPAFAAVAKVEDDSEDDDKPVLKRKHHDDEPASGSSTTGSDTQKSAPAADPNTDPDRPAMHRKDDTDSAPSDPDRPVMKRPTETKSAPNPDNDIGHTEAIKGQTDPDRPKLQRGKDNAASLRVLPSLLGMPPDMQQAVAVSDAKDRPDHPWAYNWANPADEQKMKSMLEQTACEALGLAATAKASALAPTRRTGTGTGTAATRKTTKPTPAAACPVTQLAGEQFRVFELAYGSGATLVFSAHTGQGAPAKFVTLIAQPGLYGDLRVLLKSVAYASNLDETPRMILVDAVDALADNRGELLFELRGETGRQFALYRILRGSAERIFVTTGSAYGSSNGD